MAEMTHCFRKSCKPDRTGKGEKWIEDGIVNTLNCFEFGSGTRTPEIICVARDAESHGIKTMMQRGKADDG